MGAQEAQLRWSCSIAKCWWLLLSSGAGDTQQTRVAERGNITSEEPKLLLLC